MPAKGGRLCTCLDGLDADVIPVERLVRTFAETGQRPQMTFRGILANLLQSHVLKTVAHSHIPCTWFELQRVKCCLRLAWISKGASRAALFSRPIVFFVKSCCLLFGLHTGTYEMLEKFAHFQI